MDNLNSIKIIGKGTITNGEYEKVSILGEAVALEEFHCDYLNVIGTCNLKGKVISNKVKILGEAICEQVVTTDNKLEILGQLKALEDYKANKVEVLGQGIFNKNLFFGEMDIKGEIKVSKDCEGNVFNSRGKLEIDGLLSAEDIYINPNGISTINEIGGSKIIIKKKSLFSLKESIVISNVIEGDYIELDNTQCKIVRGHDVKILANCRIDKVEYTGTLTVDKNSIVGEETCLKN